MWGTLIAGCSAKSKKTKENPHVTKYGSSGNLPLTDLLRTPSFRGATSNSGIVPPVVKFGGVLTDVNGKPLAETTGVTFSLYKDQQGGAPLWVETQNIQS